MGIKGFTIKIPKPPIRPPYNPLQESEDFMRGVSNIIPSEAFTGQLSFLPYGYGTVPRLTGSPFRGGVRRVVGSTSPGMRSRVMRLARDEEIKQTSPLIGGGTTGKPQSTASARVKALAKAAEKRQKALTRKR